MKNTIKKATQLMGFRLVRTVSSFNNPIADFDIPKNDFEVRGDELYLKKVGVSLKISDRSSILLKGYKYAVNLVSIAGARFSLEQGQVYVAVQNLRFALDEFEELYILNEIFVEGCYNIRPNDPSCVLIDIGMNVGICSLYFSGKEQFERIYSFEPFGETFELGKRNFSLNPQVSGKIHPHNFGLARQDGSLKVEYSASARGRMGVNGVPADMGQVQKEFRELPLRDAAAVLEPILKLHEDKCIVMKCDCEGGEYDIIDRLYEKGLLSRISCCMIEWHYRSPEGLVAQLQENGFTTITTLFDNLVSGMIYGFKK